MRFTSFILLLAVSVSGFHCASSTAPETKPIPVIFDTDIGNDIDDVLALQILFQYEVEKKIDLLGIAISKSFPRVVDYVDGYASLNSRGDIPLGFAYNGVNPEPHKYVPVTLDTLINGKPVLEPKRKLDDSIPEGYLLMRKLLAGQADSSVVLIVVGPETNLSRLISSKPDEFSTLSGVELVKQKVKLVSIMGGLYNKDYDFPEWNIVQDLTAAQRVFADCPVPIIASGFEVGTKLLYPAASILSDFREGDSNPLVISYKVYQPMPYDRPTWDLTSVLQGVEPELGYFDVSPAGKITVDSVGNTRFEEKPGGLHRYLKLKNNQQLVLDSMIQKTTRRWKDVRHQ
ncbi:nucleoside hydrolase [Flavihumibacter sp. UBA7668]|uniref:nucleoside hydrolase n=1 Tax=Flavihumibacter sp. UBA7668 TaxID=1946542 RepID=UPI0025C4EF22|nr:nucleoside hydrolase [Flavihumibacter sp. UBA7668]